MPVSFLPDIEISQLKVITKAQGRTPRDIENNITRPLSGFLKTLNNVRNINSQSQNGLSIITVDLRPGINLDFASIEIAEKLDQSMHFLPNDIERPLVTRTSLTDIPVLKISVTPKNPEAISLIELSDFCEKVLRRRIEQQNEVSLADLHGLTQGEIIVSPKKRKLQSQNITNEDLIFSIQKANLSIANIKLLDGVYHYDIELGNRLSSIEDIINIKIVHNDEQYKLGDLAAVKISSKESKSGYIYNNIDGVIINVLKKKGSNSIALKSELEQLIKVLRSEYLDLHFDILDDQTKILEENISNLKMSLLYGILFSGIILFFFFKHFKLSLIVFITIPISLVFVLLGYYVLGIGLNTISLTGLILGVGLMIDNAIIIIDNIQWEYDMHKDLSKACIDGTHGVIKPLLGSAFTTSSVFAPLMLLNDTAGTLFYDLSISVILALFLSLFVSYFLLPTAIHFLKLEYKVKKKNGHNSLHRRIVNASLIHKYKIIFTYFLILAIGVMIFNSIPKKRFPSLTNNALLLTYKWESSTSIENNKHRIKKFIDALSSKIEESSCIIGEKQFIKGTEKQSIYGGEVYLKNKPGHDIEIVLNHARAVFTKLFPNADFEIKPHKNTFDYILPIKKNQITCYITTGNRSGFDDPYKNEYLYKVIKKYQPDFNVLGQKEYFQIKIKEALLSQYGLQKDMLITHLKILFNKNKTTSIQNNERLIDIKLSPSEKLDFYNLIHTNTIRNLYGDDLLIGHFIDLEIKTHRSLIERSKYGESLIVEFQNYDKIKLENFKKEVENIRKLKVHIDGEYFKSEKQFYQLLYILLIVISLLFMILAAQFESLKTPLIIIAIIPISLIGSMLMLFSFGQSINLVSAVGIIAMSGIVINDAILKIDMIILNRKSNKDIRQSILNASEKRLRPIIMTSLTTILAFSPIFFTEGFGAELQIPLAFSLIGGLTFGTIASIVILPTFYYTLFKSPKVKEIT